MLSIKMLYFLRDSDSINLLEVKNGSMLNFKRTEFHHYSFFNFHYSFLTIDQPFIHRINRQRRRIVKIQLFHQIGAVLLHGF